MNSSHGIAFGGGAGFGAALLGILNEQFHMSATLASNWIIVAGGAGAVIVGLAVWAYQQKHPNAPIPPVLAEAEEAAVETVQQAQPAVPVVAAAVTQPQPAIAPQTSPAAVAAPAGQH
jgi:hypothetical protein